MLTTLGLIGRRTTSGKQAATAAAMAAGICSTSPGEGALGVCGRRR